MVTGHCTLVCRTEGPIFWSQTVSHGLTAGRTVCLSYCGKVLASSAQTSPPLRPRSHSKYNSNRHPTVGWILGIQRWIVSLLAESPGGAPARGGEGAPQGKPRGRRGRRRVLLEGFGAQLTDFSHREVTHSPTL